MASMIWMTRISVIFILFSQIHGSEHRPTGSTFYQDMYNYLSSYLNSSPVFISIVKTGLSPEVMASIGRFATQTALTEVGVPSSRAITVSIGLQDVLLRMDANSSVSDYGAAIAGSLVEGSGSSGLVNASNAFNIGLSLMNRFQIALRQTALQFGIQISN